MPTTPINGWRVPAASAAPNVPFDLNNLALDIEGSVAVLQPGAPYGVISYSPGVATDGMRLVTTAGVNTARGITHDGAGRLTLPTTGVYQVQGYLANSTASIAFMKITAKNDAGTVGAVGSVGAGTVAGSSSEIGQPLIVSTAPVTIGLWVQCAASIQSSLGFLFIARLGSL